MLRFIVVLGLMSVAFPVIGGLQQARTLEQAKANMRNLAMQTSAGGFYSNVGVPADLAGFRAQMIAYGNIGRRDPDYRKNHGSETAVDLSGDAVRTKKESETIYKSRPNPPYFNDLRLNDSLNSAAQFQAEYQASTLTVGHIGPENFQGTNMVNFYDRAKYFGYQDGFEGEGAGGSTSPDDYPEGWMKSDSHFRPWFNVGADVVEVGLGIAKGSDGFWYTCVISGLGSASGIDSPKPSAKVELSAIPGRYSWQQPRNPFHSGEITVAGPGANGQTVLKWTNSAGRSWLLYPDLENEVLQTGKDNPFYNRNPERGRTFRLVIGTEGSVTGFRFQDGHFLRQP